ncbi:MAG: tRNA-uridine 2-sulfurtransferase, partial [Actinomycetota bacterium]|nr:tRNA-uridine 2-sulfurtransferase [Actinomycetota bacterium]
GSRQELATIAITLDELSFVGDAPAPGTRVLIQHRAHGDATPARFSSAQTAESAGSAEEKCTVVFDEPVEAVAPGQSAAFYDYENPDRLLGGGIISSTSPATLSSNPNAAESLPIANGAR